MHKITKYSRHTDKDVCRIKKNYKKKRTFSAGTLFSYQTRDKSHRAKIQLTIINIVMKKIAFILAVALGSAAAFAQVNKGELKQLQAFLAQPAEHAATNAEALKITNIKDPST